MTLADLIAGSETLTVELKRDANDHDLVEAVVCLALQVPRATLPVATSTGRYLRRALGGGGGRRPRTVRRAAWSLVSSVGGHVPGAGRSRRLRPGARLRAGPAGADGAPVRARARADLAPRGGRAVQGVRRAGDPPPPASRQQAPRPSARRRTTRRPLRVARREDRAEPEARLNGYGALMSEFILPVDTYARRSKDDRGGWRTGRATRARSAGARPEAANVMTRWRRNVRGHSTARKFWAPPMTRPKPCGGGR